MLLNALKAAQRNSDWLSYSRNHNFYDAARRRYHGPAFTHANVTRAVDQAERAGLVEHERAERGALGQQSRFRATTLLPKLLVGYEPSATFVPCEVIRLKDRDGRLIDYRDTDETCRMRREMSAINETIRGSQVTLEHPDAQWHAGVIHVGSAVLYPEMMALWRVFSRRSFVIHGRLYGGWWQNVPSNVRPFLRIDGDPVSELDFPAHHCRMSYVLVGAELPNLNDLHTIPGWERDWCKRAFNILINASSFQKALGAMAKHIEGSKYVTGASRKTAAALFEAVKMRHQAVAGFFGRDAAMAVLMRHDAQMAIRILKRLMGRGIVALPIHDSFVVQKRHEGELQEAMDEAWAAFRSGKLFSSTQYDSEIQSYIWPPVVSVSSSCSSAPSRLVA